MSAVREVIEKIKKEKNELRKSPEWSLLEKDYCGSAVSKLLDCLECYEDKEEYLLACQEIKESLYELGLVGHTKAFFNNQEAFSRLANFLKKSPETIWEEKHKISKNNNNHVLNISEWRRPSVPLDSQEQIKVSVIVPIYNVEKYLEECMESLVNQTLKEIEIICINDGSTDDSGIILKNYQQKDKRVKVIYKENGGQSSARNVGINMAEGEYTIFIDSDDIIEEKTLEFLYYEAKNRDLDQLYYSAQVFRDDCQSTFVDNYYVRKHDYPDVYTGKDYFIQTIGNGDFKPAPVLYISKTSFIRENNLEFLEGVIHEDNLFTMQCLYYATRVSYANIYLYKRRIRSNSTMTDGNNFKHAYHYYLIIKAIEDFISDKSYEDMKYYEAIRQFLANLTMGAVNYVQTIEKKELLEQLNTLKLSENMDFYMRIVLLSTERKKFSNLMKKSTTAEENLTVALYHAACKNKRIEALKRYIQKLKNN